MPTASGHTRAIKASKVCGTSVYNAAGEKMGVVEEVILDKTSNNIMFAVLGIGGFLGVGEKFHPVPWSLLDFDPEKNGYVVPLSKEALKDAPAYKLEDLIQNDGEIRERSFTYYGTERYWS